MRTATTAANLAGRLGLGPGASPRRSVVLLALVALAASVAGGVVSPVPTGTGGAVATPRTAGQATAGVDTEPGRTPAPSRSVTALGLGRAFPLRVVIPAVAVDARIVPLAFEQGVLAGPPRTRFAGWYPEGTSPGELGGAVLHGYLGDPGRPARERAAFAGLDRLRRGDTVEVVRADGVTAVFTVEQVAPFSPAPSSAASTGEATLRLVGTPAPVEGHWSPAARPGGADDRPELVVFATLGGEADIQPDPGEPVGTR